MTRAKLLSFSPGGEKLAQGGSDGVLRIWDTSTGCLEQEYQPAEHLTAKPSCLQFSPLKSVSPKKKVAANAGSEYSLLAMGTMGGRVLVYSLEKKEVVTTLTHAPPHAIQDIAWHSPTKLFSLAADDTLVEWNVTTGERIFSCEVNGGSSMCALGNKNLCLGKSKIHHIHLLKKSGVAKVQRTFTGHTSEVSQLVAIPASEGSAKYFLSASQDDRFVYAWNVDDDSSEASASFLVSDRVCGLTVKGAHQDNTIAIAATTHKGALVYFTQHLNGNKQKKAVKCTGTLNIKSESEGDRKTTVPILCSFFINDIEESVIIVYGDSTFLKFERISVKELNGKQELVRSVATSVSKTETALTQTLTPNVATDAVVLGPANIDLSLSVRKKNRKRKREEVDGEETLPMEARLNALAVDQTTSTTDEEKWIRGSNQVHRLLQGLHSMDATLLEPVINRKDPKEIRRVVNRLPTQAVVPLIKYLTSLITGRNVKSCASVRWLKSLLYYHMGHLSTLPDHKELLAPFLSEAANRAAALNQMSQLHARLDLVLDHVTARHQEAKEQPTEKHQPLLVYEEESSDEEDMMEGFGVSETEDNWEELSDFGEINGHTDDEEMEVDHSSSRKMKIKVESVESASENEDSDDDEEEDGISDVVDDDGEGSESDSDHVLVLSGDEDE